MSIKRFESGARMSQAVTHGGIVYLAGQIGKPGEDAATQTRAVLASIDRLLGETGTDRSRLLQVTIWLADMADFAAMNEVWEEWLGGESAPARATGEVKLATPDYKVEIIVTAALP
ncbi:MULTISPECIES: RidA family protein [unclassified Sphingomonas]|uniref:RidA family protein n=1 Tax=unclassified Sphingomonas TaxID=196159 RepID=UPI002151B946|nr:MULTISPECIES: RidA family protein [unclassified Sphingomonas]MCR5869558.1 RidA family protein [Sphingomonas sp. J344]UUX98726.1 RidA family protein [Sphingomonas sp. J315]